MKKLLFFCLAGLLVACATNDPNMNNPLLSEFNTPFGTPPFGQIRTEHYKPAIEVAMKQHKDEIKAILDNPQEPDFENTIAPLDASGRLLGRIVLIFSNLYGADTSPQMQELAMELMPMISQHSDEIMLDPLLFQRVKAVYEKRETLNLSAQALRTLEKYYNDFVREGANLSDEDKAKLMEINTQISTASLQYGDNILKETNTFRLVVDNVEDLKGLPQENILAAAEQAKAEGMEGKWVFTPNKPSWIPFLQYVQNRELREKLYKGYYMRGDNDNDNDNKALVDKLVNLRLRRAQLLGYKTYADYVLEENMAKNPANVYGFLERVWTPALKVAKEELARMQQIADAEGAGCKLASWDWW